MCTDLQPILQDTSQKPNAGNLSNFTAETYLEIATGNRVIQGSDMSEGLVLWEAFLEIELYFPKEQRESKEFLFFTFASEAFEVFTLLDRKKSLQKFVIYLTFRAGSILIKVQKIKACRWRVMSPSTSRAGVIFVTTPPPHPTPPHPTSLFIILHVSGCLSPFEVLEYFRAEGW